MKPVLGILGGIGSGKSAVASELAQRGGRLINADALGHEALRQTAIRNQVVARFGAEILNAHGEIDRKQLGKKVFADVGELRALEAIVFTYIQRRILDQIEESQRDPRTKFVVLDAAVMLEANWTEPCDKLIYVDVPRPVRLERIRVQRGWTPEQVEARERAQMPPEEKRRRADAVLDNSGTIDDLCRQVDVLLERWNLA